MAVDYNLIGERLKKARLEKGLTQDNLAESLNISIAYLSRIETGTTKVNLRRLSEICNLLSISEAEIISGVSDDSENYLNDDLSNLLKNCSLRSNVLFIKLQISFPKASLRTLHLRRVLFVVINP